MELFRLIVLLFLIFFSSCSTNKQCTPELFLKKEYDSLDESEYLFYNEVYKNNYEFNIYNLVNEKSDEYDIFFAKIIIDLINNNNPDYIFKEKFNKRYSYVNYYSYFSLDSNRLAGKLIETYQKHDSIYIGKHTWYKYELLKGDKTRRIVSKQINYDTIYPICWSMAIKIAKKYGIQEKTYSLIPPKGYPQSKKPRDSAFWKVYNKNDSIIIDAYSGKRLIYN